MFESFLDQWARTIAGKARVIAVACGIATILAAVIITRLPISADILDVMPENHPGIVAFTDFLRDFGVLNGLIIVVESPEPAPESLVTAVQIIGEQLKSSKYV